MEKTLKDLLHDQIDLNAEIEELEKQLDQNILAKIEELKKTSARLAGFIAKRRLLCHLANCPQIHGVNKIIR